MLRHWRVVLSLAPLSRCAGHGSHGCNLLTLGPCSKSCVCTMGRVASSPARASLVPIISSPDIRGRDRRFFF